MLDPGNKIDPSGLTCETKDNKTTCKVDGYSAGQNQTQQDRAQAAAPRVAAALAQVVDHLRAAPNKNITVGVEGRSFTTKAGTLADRLSSARLELDGRTAAERGNSDRAQASGGPTNNRLYQPGAPKVITVFQRGFGQDYGGGRQFITRDLRRTFAHEGLHLVPEEEAFSMRARSPDWADAHQDGYRRAADSALLGCCR